MASFRHFFQRAARSDPADTAAAAAAAGDASEAEEGAIAAAWTPRNTGNNDSNNSSTSGGGTGAIAIVGSVPASSGASRYFARKDSAAAGRRGPMSSSSSSSSSEGEEGGEGAALDAAATGAPQSASYFRPRTLDGYSRYLEAVYMEGELQKQSSEDPARWKTRWFVMHESKLFYYKRRADIVDKKPTDRTCCAVISLEDIDSVTTAKDFGAAAFQIRLESRRYILRAESRDRMHDWLFNFQKSIANIVSALSRQAEHRPNRLCNSLSRRKSLSRVNRSVSFDYQDYSGGGGLVHQSGSAIEDYLRGRASGGFFSSESFSDDSITGRTSPRRASSPVSIGSYGPRSPLMFAFDDMSESQQSVSALRNEPLVEESKEELEGVEDIQAALMATQDTSGTPPMEQTLSPPVAPAGKYIPRYLRNRSAATPTSPPPSESTSPPPAPLPATSPPAAVGRWVPRHQREHESPPTTTTATTTTPAPAAGRWVPRHQREGYADLQPVESFSFNTRESLTETFVTEDSYSSGGDVHGVTSLLGVRSAMEDVCCCVPDLNALIEQSADAPDTFSMPKQSLYAIFDGHSGVRAATFSNQRLVSYLTAHESFLSNPKQAFEDCFKRIDGEFLEKAEDEGLSDGTTAAVVLIRGNRLMTANVGDSRAVVSIGGKPLDVIEEQTPGRKDERTRIEENGGWVREERELHMSKLHSMDLSDPEIQQKAERVVQWVNIYRVNGELAVSRAIGDIDYKGEALSKYEYWAFPEGHGRVFHGDLIISRPEYVEMEITPEFEFLILACDGLWDTITSKEAVRHVGAKLREGYSAKQASHSLANLAIRSGSSDNVSVVIVLFNADHLARLMPSLAPGTQRSQDADRTTSEVEHQGRCATCGRQNPTTYQFCANCGHQLA